MLAKTDIGLIYEALLRLSNSTVVKTGSSIASVGELKRKLSKIIKEQSE